jgi:hypothetical protein
MKTKDSKAQLEAWDWKQKAYEEVKHLSLHEQIKFIVAAAQPLTDVIKGKVKKDAISK